MYGRAYSAQRGGKHDAQCTGSAGDSAYAYLFSLYSVLEGGWVVG